MNQYNIYFKFHKLFHPVKPMLSGKRNIEEMKQILFGKTISIEIKYDGERIQCHFNKEQLKFFTRFYQL